MTWQAQFKGNILSWLLEEDDPGLRYLALRDLLDIPPPDAELTTARELAHHEGPIAAILREVNNEGCWVNPGHGYLPKDYSTVWSLIMLAQLGAKIEQDQRIEKACQYLCD